MKHPAVVGSLAAVLLLCGGPSPAQVHRIGDMTSEEIRVLDRSRTVVLLVGGILEEHGPFLPVATDGLSSERMAWAVAERIVERPGWTAVIFPTLPLGQGAANIIGGRHTFPGSFDVRADTLRAVYMDLADDLGEQGFRWVFIVDGHGSPNSNRALDQAADYFRDTGGGMMVHLFGLMSLRTCCGAPLAALLTDAQEQEEGFSVHASAGEHSEILFLRPDLVPEEIRAAPPVTGRRFRDLVSLATRPDWPGYFGSPRLANPAVGAQAFRLGVDTVAAAVLRMLDGWDPRGEPRYADVLEADPDVAAVDTAAAAEDVRREQRQRDWLAKVATRPSPGPGAR